MVVGTDHRCPQCMNIVEKKAPICPHCHYDMQKKQIDMDYLEPGFLLQDRYIVGNILHKNSESTVYIAYDQELNLVVRIKEFFPKGLVSRNTFSHLVAQENKQLVFHQMREEFLHLHQSLSKLRTLSSLVQVYSIFEQNSTIYAVLEQIKGETLRNYLSVHYGELPWEELSPMMTEAMKALHHLHKMGIMHYGLSPETIWVTQTGKMKISGFRIPSFRQRNGEIKPDLYAGYAAPEQYDELDTCGPFTDVYSLAAVMYKTLTGTMPTESNTRSYNDNLIPPDILNSHVPKNVSIAVMSALTLSPKIRTQTMDDLFADVITPPRATSQYSIDYSIREKQGRRENTKAEDTSDVRSRKYIFAAMGITLCVLLFASAILIFFLFSQHVFG